MRNVVCDDALSIAELSTSNGRSRAIVPASGCLRRSVNSAAGQEKGQCAEEARLQSV